MTNANAMAPLSIDEASSNRSGADDSPYSNVTSGCYRGIPETGYDEVTVNLKRFDDIIERIEIGYVKSPDHLEIYQDGHVISNGVATSDRLNLEKYEEVRGGEMRGYDVFESMNGGSHNESAVEDNFDQDSSDASDRGPMRRRQPSPRIKPYYESQSRFQTMTSTVKRGDLRVHSQDRRPLSSTNSDDGCEKIVFGSPGNDIPNIPSIVVNDHEESSVISSSGQSGFQGQLYSDTSNNSIPSPAMRTWADSPSSCYNMAVSGSSSWCSSRTPSPSVGLSLESQLMPTNVSSSSLGSLTLYDYMNTFHASSNSGNFSQAVWDISGSTLSSSTAPVFTVPQAMSSPSSSCHSYGDIPSPSNYQTPLSQRIEDQLHEDLACFSIWSTFSNERATSAITNEPMANLDSNELQLVEEVLRDLGEKCDGTEEPQVVPTSRRRAISYEERRSIHTARDENTFSNGFTSNCTTDYCSYTSEYRTCREQNELANALLEGTRVSSCSGGTFDIDCYPSKSLIRCSNNEERADSIQNLYERETFGQTPLAGNTVDDHGYRRDNDVLLYELQPSEAYVPVSVVSCGSTAFTEIDRSTDQCSSPESTFNDFQIPKTVRSFKSKRSRRCLERNIMPWPSLNLPAIKASERLKEGLDPKDVERAMVSLLKRPIEELAKGDEDGDTLLMCLVGNPKELAQKKAYLVPLVERLSANRGALSMTNNRGEDALYLAAMNCPEMPYVAGYLAAAMLQKGIDIGQRLYHTRGDTLIHAVAAKGDTHGEVLAELLALRTIQGNAVFDLSNRNYDGRSALHVAVEAHVVSSLGPKSIATVRLLLDNGADPRIKETRCGDTALHMAASLSCDPLLVKVLLSKTGSGVVDATNYNYNTALHMAVSAPLGIPIERQSETCRHLVRAGAQTNLQNRQGKTPLGLVLPSRKEILKRILHKKFY